MNELLSKLSDLDHILTNMLANDEINPEEIHLLVDERDQILQRLIQVASENQEFSHSVPWRDAIARTKQLVEQMQSATDRIGDELQRYRYGQKSVQQYKKFL
jgi:flagellar rod protein FlaI